MRHDVSPSGDPGRRPPSGLHRSRFRPPDPFSMGRMVFDRRSPSQGPIGLALVLLAIICLLSSPAVAQASSSSSSASSSASSRPSSSATSASGSASSTSSASTSTPTISLSGFPALLTLPALNSSRPSLQVNLPTNSPLYITINICALTSNTSILPTVLVSTASPPSWTLGTRTSPDSGSGGTSEGGWNLKSRSGNLWEMTLDEGFGNWTWTGDPVGTSLMFGLGLLADGTTQSVSASGNVAIQLGVSSSGPIHSITTSQPFLGDTTNSTALIFSPLLQDSPHYQPTYPNYTLPPAQLVLPSFSSSTDNMVSNASFIGPAPNLTLIMVPTGSSPTQDGLDHSLCAIRAANSSTGSVASPSNMIVNRTEPSWVAVDGEEGYRQYWVVGNLVSGSNYTAWVYDEDKQSLSPPIWLATKDASFQCPLVLPNSMCPSVAYAAPFDVNATSSTSPLTSLPDNITSILTSSLQSFSTSLLSQACGRDYYSHVSTCADCYAAYRDWLCRVLVPRCADAVSSTTADPPAATVSRTAANPRDPGIYTPSYDYVELLPCLSVCNAADRTCPTSLQFRCPVRGVTANSSYGFVGNNADSGDGAKDTGWPAADQWGNRWCNG